VKLEILHTRDSDGGCYLDVYIDGEPVTEFRVQDVDPGRGYDIADWRETTEFVAADETLTEAFRGAVVTARETWENADGIDHSGDGSPGPGS
jgi:hypothetical protein